MTLFFQLLIGASISGIIYSLMSVGFNLIYQRTSSGDFLYGTAAILAVYTLYFFDTRSSLPDLFIVPVILLIVLALGFVGLLINKYVYSLLEVKVGSGMSMFVFSFMAYFFIQGLIAFIFGDKFKIYTFTIDRLNLPNFIQPEQLFVLLTGTLCLVLYFLLFDKKKWLPQYAVFTSFALAAIAGILYGIDVGFRPSIGLILILHGITASIVAGIGNIRAGIVVAFLIGLLESFGSWQFNTNNKDMLLFLFLALSYIFVYRASIIRFFVGQPRS
jgi:branched-chain amino acid transport system permease protein